MDASKVKEHRKVERALHGVKPNPVKKTPMTFSVPNDPAFVEVHDRFAYLALCSFSALATPAFAYAHLHDHLTTLNFHGLKLQKRFFKSIVNGDTDATTHMLQKVSWVEELTFYLAPSVAIRSATLHSLMCSNVLVYP